MLWLPWQWLVRRAARAQGFLDPVILLSQLRRFAQPAEVDAPRELLREGLVLQARGLINSQAIQHNLDWIWPYWVVRQFDPRDNSFVPRAFDYTQINQTHRNWTALGLPDFPELVLVDPRGLVTPFYDGWSIDAWILTEKGADLVPSRLPWVQQTFFLGEEPVIETDSRLGDLRLVARTDVAEEQGAPVCRMSLEAFAAARAWLAVSVRPYNPEGVSFVHEIRRRPDGMGWKVNGNKDVLLDAVPLRHGLSKYRRGDVYHDIRFLQGENEIQCPVGMATGAALFEMTPGIARRLTVRVPLAGPARAAAKKKPEARFPGWKANLDGLCRLSCGNKRFRFLYDAAIVSLILHSPKEVYPGPYTYKRFWFRDAAFILDAMLCAGLQARAERAIDAFLPRQKLSGYFFSQEGEWDSNGEALWAMRRFCEITGRPPKAHWIKPIRKAAAWIVSKRASNRGSDLSAGLLPAGFSAEHFGPNDYYYWDDFWGIAGLQAAALLLEKSGDRGSALRFRREAESFFRDASRSIARASTRLGRPAMPASPHRRLDAAAVGSLVASYPLKLLAPDDPAVRDTLEFLMEKCFLNGGLFQDISHSGINAYLTLHVAQTLLRAGDARFFNVMNAAARLASPTGQWPEAIHPLTGGGCMGDGQHVWASAEWVLVVRNSLVREEGPDRLILCSGVTGEWFWDRPEITFGPAATPFGDLTLRIERGQNRWKVAWKGEWRGRAPAIEIRMPGLPTVCPAAGETSAEFGEAAA